MGKQRETHLRQHSQGINMVLFSRINLELKVLCLFAWFNYFVLLHSHCSSASQESLWFFLSNGTWEVVMFSLTYSKHSQNGSETTPVSFVYSHLHQITAAWSECYWKHWTVTLVCWKLLSPENQVTNHWA